MIFSKQQITEAKTVQRGSVVACGKDQRNGSCSTASIILSFLFFVLLCFWMFGPVAHQVFPQLNQVAKLFFLVTEGLVWTRPRAHVGYVAEVALGLGLGSHTVALHRIRRPSILLACARVWKVVNRRCCGGWSCCGTVFVVERGCFCEYGSFFFDFVPSLFVRSSFQPSSLRLRMPQTNQT